LPALDQLINS